MAEKPQDIINVRNLDLVFGDGEFHLENIKDVSIREGEILGILGESGCGKSTFGKCLIGLINNRDKLKFKVTNLSDSRIEFPLDPSIFPDGNVLNGKKKELRKYREHVQMIFQNPRSALNLNMPVYKILQESLKVGNPSIRGIELSDRVEKIAERFEIGGRNWQRIAKSKPKNLCGGERRRLGVAKIFALNPNVIIADEPVASLDVSIRGKILNTLLKEWKKRRESKHPLTLVFISHDFGMINRICHRIIVFYGDIHVKRGTVVEILDNKNPPPSVHPYTQVLQDAAEYIGNPASSRRLIQDSNPVRRDIVNDGCVFVNKCSSPRDECFIWQPNLTKEGDHRIACVL